MLEGGHIMYVRVVISCMLGGGSYYVGYRGGSYHVCSGEGGGHTLLNQATIMLSHICLC